MVDDTHRWGMKGSYASCDGGNMVIGRVVRLIMGLILSGLSASPLAAQTQLRERLQARRGTQVGRSCLGSPSKRRVLLSSRRFVALSPTPRACIKSPTYARASTPSLLRWLASALCAEMGLSFGGIYRECQRRT